MNMSSQCATVTKTNAALNYVRWRQTRQTIGIILHLYGIIDTITRIPCPKVYISELECFWKKSQKVYKIRNTAKLHKDMSP